MRTYHDITSAYPEIIKDVLTNGSHCAPRGKPIREMLAYQFKLEDYSQPTPLQKSRKLPTRFALLEGLLNICGKVPTDIILHVNKNMKDFLNPITNTWDGAYPVRIGASLFQIRDQLEKDPDTRQAVIPIYSVSDAINTNSLDRPCTLNLQFLIRDGRLNMISTMRSNDILWGLPNDVSQFGILGKALASDLKIPTGWYIHQAGSMHSYNEREDQLRAVLDAQKNGTEEYSDLIHPEWNGMSLNEARDHLKEMFNKISFWITTEQADPNSLPQNRFPEPIKTYMDYLIGVRKVSYK